MRIESLILKKLVSDGQSINPIGHCDNGFYTDYDEWTNVTIENKNFDINFYSDGVQFFITAYELKLTDNGTFDRLNDQFFHVKVYNLQGVNYAN